jgi:hypothetical protein
VTVEHAAALTADQASSLPFGQAHWWLRLDGGDFVKLPRKVRGDAPFKFVLSLEPGRYVLGVGPPREGVRRDVVVDANAPAPTPAVEAAVATKGTGKATLDLTFKSVVITGDLDAHDRDGATAWLEGLGATVKSGVSKKVDYLIVGRDPGATKLARAKELGIPQLTEAQLREQLGLDVGARAPAAAIAPSTAPAAPKARAGSGKEKVARLLEELKPSAALLKSAEKMVGPQHYRDLGLTDSELWGFVTGPRGGSYTVHVALDDRARFAVRCHRDYQLCAHAVALMLTSQRHFVPPAPAPAGHREAARYESIWE